LRCGRAPAAGPDIQYTREKVGAPLTLTVYAGADGRFSLYEDDGTSNQYQKGGFARVPMVWNDKAATLPIGAREARYAGMLASRVLHIRWVGPNAPKGGD